MDTKERKPAELTPTKATKRAERHLYLVEALVFEDEDDHPRRRSTDPRYVDPWSRKTPAA